MTATDICSGAERDVILRNIIAWATRTAAVQTLILTGSLARGDGLADALSDIDIEVIADHPDVLIADFEWLSEIGPLVTVLPLNPSAEQRWATRLAIYSSGTKVDYTLASVTRLREMASQQKLVPLYERGYRILLDKPGLAVNLPRPSGRVPTVPLPSSEAFRAAVEEFWFEAVHVPKYLVRGELWLVKQRDQTMKALLLQMLEWHAVSSRAVDVWHIGTRMKQWVDGPTWDELQHVFGRFDASDCVRAFEATVALYSRLAQEVARSAGLDYPASVETGIMAICRPLLSCLKE
ncbi:aminoglycoside 6-adenylyltransferase [Steroidobacter sp. S1-65]|uniref:Aminoglycoside 6-adenylyltransferase n=1 Tax=Steroidobacter gossypii TaxID=2805490 RepID=A0ABS1X1G2_9GAMM|nr:aminoglycoside 6-adenylyltransferase [Steroidobacter gossypii]MBM0107066.1 aminoglycoside 6-adenylyltransferase [Steroidobacter gossypii]